MYIDIISKCGTGLVIYQISYAEAGKKALLHVSSSVMTPLQAHKMHERSLSMLCFDVLWPVKMASYIASYKCSDLCLI